RQLLQVDFPQPRFRAVEAKPPRLVAKAREERQHGLDVAVQQRPDEQPRAVLRLDHPRVHHRRPRSGVSSSLSSSSSGSSQATNFGSLSKSSSPVVSVSFISPTSTWSDSPSADLAVRNGPPHRFLPAAIS